MSVLHCTAVLLTFLNILGERQTTTESQGVGQTRPGTHRALHLHYRERERERERERVAPTREETEIEITDWSAGLVSLLFSQITGVRLDSAVAPLRSQYYSQSQSSQSSVPGSARPLTAPARLKSGPPASTNERAGSCGDWVFMLWRADWVRMIEVLLCLGK